MVVEDITTDFSDGIKLINLIEILSEGSLGKCEKKALVSKGTETTVARQAQYVFRQNIEKALHHCAAQGGAISYDVMLIYLDQLSCDRWGPPNRITHYIRS